MKDILFETKSAALRSLRSGLGRAVFVLGTILSLVLYYVAIEVSASVSDFLNSTTLIITITNIIFIIVNSLLIGLSFSMIYMQVKENINVNESGGSLVQVIASAFFSIASTGCYVCGSLLLPALGITASLTSLPFAGLEIKVLTFLLLLYTIRNLSRNILGTCEIVQPKQYKLSFGTSSMKFSNRHFFALKPYLVTFAFVSLIYLLPVFSGMFGISTPIVAREDFVCSVNHT